MKRKIMFNIHIFLATVADPEFGCKGVYKNVCVDIKTTE